MAVIASGTLQGYLRGDGSLALADPATEETFNFPSVAAADAAFKFSANPAWRDILKTVIYQCARAQNVTLPVLATWSFDPTLSAPFTITFAALNPAQEIG